MSASHCGFNSYFGLPPFSLTFSPHKITAKLHLDFMQQTNVILQTSGWFLLPICIKTALQQSKVIMSLTILVNSSQIRLQLTIIYISNSFTSSSIWSIKCQKLVKTPELKLTHLNVMFHPTNRSKVDKL